MPKLSKKNSRKRIVSINHDWPVIHARAAGIDIGSREHWVAVPPDDQGQNVRRFGAYTEDLEAMAAWLKERGVTTVAMEATGVYWIAAFQILERHGFEVLLVNPRQIKNVSGRKTDVQDCQWIQRLHTYGLLSPSFRPADQYCIARTLLRYRSELVGDRSKQVLHMQKALHLMNIKLTQVLSDISGESGTTIIQAILQGERNPLTLAALASTRVKASRQTIAKALVGDYRTEHLFVLKTAFELFTTYEAQIDQCDQQLVDAIAKLDDELRLDAKPIENPKPVKKADKSMSQILRQKLGVDLTQIESIGVTTAATVLCEVGPDVSRFPSEKHFVSWLGLCPDNRISGGKVLSSHTRSVKNRLSDALRISASTLERSQSGLGGYYRKMKAKLGPVAGITATAHKLARIIYQMLRKGEEYVRQGLEDYEAKFKARKIAALKKHALALGFQVIENQPVPCPVS